MKQWEELSKREQLFFELKIILGLFGWAMLIVLIIYALT